jgi:hypothetical protein
MLLVMLKKYFPFLILIAIIAIVFFHNNAHHTYLLPPKSVHVWRQTDCASYALNYFQNKVDFWHPQVHHRLAVDGRTVSEFPIIYFFASKLYQYFGYHDYFIRLINFVIFCIGIIYVFKLSALFIKDKVIQFFPALIVLTSPYLFYYGLNFLPDVVALSFSFIGVYYYFIYQQSNCFTILILACVFFVLAAVLKITAGIPFVAVAAWVMLQEWKLNWQNKTIVAKKFVIISCSFFIIFWWYYYAALYNKTHHYDGNTLGMLPIWQMSKAEIIEVFQRFRKEWKGVILCNVTWLFFLISLLFLGVVRKISYPIYFLILITILGNLLFSIGWFQAFFHHDYYMINLFGMFIFLAIGCGIILEKYLNNINLKYIIYVGVFALIVKAQFHSKNVQNDRYANINNGIPNSWYEVQPYMRNIGIQRTDLVLHLGDASTNISLYLFNNPGWDECYAPDGNIIEYYRKKGAKYLIISNENWMQKTECLPYMKHKIGQYKQISFYKL